MTVILSAISRTFVQLVADEDDAATALGETPQQQEDLFRLLRREDGRRLVQDEDARVAIERLEDLDALLLADRQSRHLGVGIDVEAERGGQLADPATCLRPVKKSDSTHGLVAEDDVLRDSQHRNEHEVLMDHADPACDRIRWAGDLRRLAIQQDLTLVGHGQAVQDVHQSGLAGAVLAKQRVDLAGPDIKVDVVVGNHARVALRDPAHLERGDGRRRRHCVWRRERCRRVGHGLKCLASFAVKG